MKNLLIILSLFLFSCNSDEENKKEDLKNESVVVVSGNLSENLIFKEYLPTHYYNEFKGDIIFFDGSSKTITIRNDKNCPSGTFGNETYNKKIKFIDLYVRIIDRYDNVRFSEKKRVNFPDFSFGRKLNFNVKNGVISLVCEN